MKTISLIIGKTYTTKATILDVVRKSQMGMDLETMRRRCKILELLEHSTDTLTLEDSDFVVLCDAIKAYSWGVANPELMAIVEGILAA